MEVLYVLVPLGVGVALLAGAVFWFAAEQGQFDEGERGGRGIFDDPPDA